MFFVSLSHRVLAAALLANLSLAAAQAQELVQNGSFEAPQMSAIWEQRTPGAVFGGWTVDSVGQGIVHVGQFGGPLAVDGAQCVELNFYQACGISQTLTTQPGGRYLLTLEMAGQINAGPDVKQMRVDWDGASVGTLSWSRSGTGGQWVRHSLALTASGEQTVLHFFGLTTVDGGPYLDAVSVTPITCPADFNDDGGVDGSDVQAFFTAWEAADGSSDLNGDGGIDGADVGYFFERWEAGC